jgi:hypothetical protein
MKATPFFWVAVSIILCCGVALSQQPLELKLSGDVSISAPPGWKLGAQFVDSIEIHVPLVKTGKLAGGEGEKEVKPRFVIASEAGMLITREHRRDHAEAVRRLAEIASEYAEAANPVVIAGWPAIERRYRSVMPQPGDEEASRGNILTSFATTAVAVGTTVIRFETMLAPDADPKLLDQALSIARSLKAPEGQPEGSRRELEEVKKLTRPPRTPAQAAPEPPKELGPAANRRPGRPSPGVAVQVQAGLGELEVATNDGQHVVVAANSGFSFSDNFGATWTFGGGTPCNQAACDGDPSLSVGNSGDIYYAWIGGTSSTALSDGVSRSIDNGHTFTFRGLSATCPGTTGCTVADQEHIAADRNNAAAGGDDRVYSVWRNFAPSFSIRISCSADGGTTWTGGVAIGAGDLPRVSVGGDGFVYVAWPSGGNMMLHKFSNCDGGFTPQVGWPVTVSAFTNVVCPVPGLDRCNGRNILSSQKVAVDDLDSNHIYYAFATSTGAGNEDVMVFDSTDGGATFPRSVRVNNAVTARRYMPWISTYGGVAAVSWYDRRNSTAANNDLTRFFIGGAAVRGPNLVALTETDLSGANDTQCSTWPCATNASTDSESCSVQPQLAGRCMVTFGPPPVGSGTPCDFSSTTCPVGESCLFNRGCPKYGDYNGNAAGAGRMYSAWSSAVPPASVGGAGGSIKVYASADRIPSDFFVRDWNASPNFDNGTQPSTNPVFWATSDVWNQSTGTAAAPGPDGSVLGDPPSRAGSNFAYARVFRRAPAMSTAPDATVTANFFFGDYGLGSPFVPIGSETVTFTAADNSLMTPAHSWTVPAGASSHLCLAVQIEGPNGDTFALPTISGIAPGPADPLIIADNNKAQRNLQDTIGTSAGTELIAIVGNIEKERRPVRLRMSIPGDVRISGTFDVIGGTKAKITNDSRIDLGVLAPGEIRFLRVHADSLDGVDKPTPVHVFEDTTPPANGFSILLHRESIEKVVARNLKELAGLLERLAEVDRNILAKRHAKLALEASPQANEKSFLTFLKTNRNDLSAITTGHMRKTGGKDTFGVRAAERDLWKALEQNKSDLAALALTELIERLDAQVTAEIKASGGKY